MKYFRLVIAFLFLQIQINNSLGYVTIFDSELHNVFMEIANPIFKAAKIKNPKIYFILSDEVNAFTNGNENIYIFTGLITKIRNPDMLRAVIAHEVGHIKSNHVVRHSDNIEKEFSNAIPQILLGAVAAGVSSSPEIFAATMLISSHTSSRKILKNSREFEITADNLAVNYLEKSGFCKDSLTELFEYLHKKELYFKGNSYDLTHPLSIERINNIKLLKSKICHKNNFSDSNLKFKFEKILAKLIAYQDDNPDFSSFSEDAKLYGLAINHMKKSDKIKSLLYINKLANKYPNDPYILQQKAEILLHFGDFNSLNLYSKVRKLINDPNLEIEYSMAGIILSSSENDLIKYINILEKNFFVNNYNLTSLEFLSIGYDKINKKGQSLYFKSLFFLQIGDKDKAKKLAIEAKKFLNISSIYNLRLDDIILQSNNNL